MNYWERYHTPLYITENGIGLYEDIAPDRIEDDQRIDYMDSHIKEWMSEGILPGRHSICIPGKTAVKSATV